MLGFLVEVSTGRGLPSGSNFFSSTASVMIEGYFRLSHLKNAGTPMDVGREKGGEGGGLAKLGYDAGWHGELGGSQRGLSRIRRALKGEEGCEERIQCATRGGRRASKFTKA